MYTNNTAIENFISFCDDMMIANESIRDVGRTLRVKVEKAILKLRHIIRRFLYNLYKLKKWYIPEEVNQSICNLLTQLENPSEICLNVKDIDSYISNIKMTPDWRLLNVTSKFKEYSNSEYIELNTNSVITQLKNCDRNLEDSEKMGIIWSNSNIEGDFSYTKNMITLYSFKLDVISQFFKWGKQKNKDGQIIDLGESISVQIDDRNLF